MKKIIIMLFLITLLSGCNLLGEFGEEADEKFGDQNFKTSIALIELHNVRNGSYPDSLDDIEYTGDWDAIYLNGVEYTKLEEGYELNLTRGWAGMPDELIYPPEFWNGLGLKKSNLKVDSK